MPKGVYAAASAMLSESKSVDVISHNIANAQSPGFRRVIALQQSFSETMKQMGRNGVLKTDGGAGVVQDGVYRNFDNGNIQETGNPYDVALRGSGFLMVESPDGEYLTRSGHFTRSGTGQMVNSEDWPVVGQGGPVNIPENASAVEIDMSGRIYALTSSDNGPLREFIDQLRIVDVATRDLSSLRAINGQYFAVDDLELADSPQTEVMQKKLESANVEPMRELVDLIAAQRRYESAQKALQAHLNKGGNYSEILRGT